MTSFEQLARTAYYEYAMACQSPKPHWYDLPLDEKNAWILVVKKIQEQLAIH